MTGAGIYGTITALGDDDVWVEIAPDVTIRMAKRAVGSKIEPDDADDAAIDLDPRPATTPTDHDVDATADEPPSSTTPRSTGPRTDPWPASANGRASGPSPSSSSCAVLGLLYTVVSGDRPLLGLDLQGGVSVVLQPRDADVPAANLEQAKRIIDKRINALGVAESEITIQGKTILVQIPGVKDKDRALKLVGQTAELQFRPVLRGLPAADGRLGHR